MSTSQQFYSYLWLRVDGSPYYAGKGFGNRAYRGAAHNVHCPKDRIRILVFPMLNEAEAFESEIALIELFGRKDLGTGCLRNLTSGGEGRSGAVVSDETRQKQSAAKKGKPSPRLGQIVSDKTRKKQSESARRRNPSTRKSWSTGKHLADETKKKQSLSLKHFWATRERVPISEETRKKMRQAKLGKRGNHTGFKNSDASKEKMRAAALNRRKEK